MTPSTTYETQENEYEKNMEVKTSFLYINPPPSNLDFKID